MFSYKRVAMTVIGFTFALSVILIMIIYKSPKRSEADYILKEYHGNIALYKGEEVISVYDGVILSAFPKSDRQKFIDGMHIDSPETAQEIIEDYDG